MTRLTLFLIIVAFFLILMTCSCAGSYVPYYEDKVFTIQYPYEGFKNKKESFTAMKDAIVSTISGEPKKEGNCKKVEGFGLMPAPYTDEVPIDRFSALKSSKVCKGSSYSTSTGYICMDDEATKLLTTRGGNISGGDSQIGSA